MSKAPEVLAVGAGYGESSILQASVGHAQHQSEVTVKAFLEEAHSGSLPVLVCLT